MISLAPAVEAERVQSVIDWSLVVYMQAWRDHAGISATTWSPSSGLHTPEQAGLEAQGFDAAAQAARANVPPQSWDQAWAGFEAGFLAAQGAVKGIPVEWVEERKGMLAGALSCAYLGAVAAGATTIEEALSSIGPIGVQLFAAENAELAALTKK